MAWNREENMAIDDDCLIFDERTIRMVVIARKNGNFDSCSK
jgi:hypothetical protein